MAWRRAREAARADELSVRMPAADTEEPDRPAAAPGLLPEALVAAARPALPVVDSARRRAREASRALEVEVFAVCAMVYPVASMFTVPYQVQPRPSKTTNAMPWLWV
jgi:hypothetical protein